MSGPLPELVQISECLTALDDSKLLTTSRNVSAFYGVSIYRWALKRTTLYLSESIASGGAALLAPADVAHTPENFVPSLGKEWLNHLSLRDARELSSFELSQVTSAL